MFVSFASVFFSVTFFNFIKKLNYKLKMSTNSILDQNLRYISVRSQWGCQPIPNSIQTIEDKGHLFLFLLSSYLFFLIYYLFI